MIDLLEELWENLKNNNMKELITAFILATFMLLFISVLITLPFMLLWNWLMPIIFGLTKITFWQSLGLLILSGMLFRTSTKSEKQQ
mgnify:CR=1 FL=1